jgi:alpha-mannosidase
MAFIDKNSERYTLSRRIGTIADHVLRDYMFPQSVGTGDFEFRDGQYSIGQLNEGAWRHFDSESERWGYPECYAWFRQTVVVPKEFAGWPVVYEIRPADGGWRDHDPQCILFADGKIVQGVDQNHSYALLLEKAKGGEVIQIAVNAYTDLHAWRGQVRMRAALKTVNSLAQRLYFDLKTPLEVAELHEADDLARVRLLQKLNAACNLLELGGGLEAFNVSALEACEYLKEEVYGGKGKCDATASCVGHTHIDVAWLWRLRQTRDKAGRSFATVLKYMEQYPEYVFMSPQAQLYDYVKKDYPEVYEGIKRRIREGRWEAEGSMWVESDTNVVSGESLVRQFLVGKRFFKDEFGVENKIMWLPDVFGYSGALPQIIKKSGLKYFMTTKISWNEYDKLPYDTFMWQGIDGTRVLAHFATGSGAKSTGHFTTYNSYLSPDQVIGGWKRYSNKDLNQEYLISFGHGDGGGGPTIEMLEHGRRMAKGIEGCPVAVQQPARKFFEELEAQVAGNPRLPVWAGELYLQFHRGTLTSEAKGKRYNRKSELLYHDVETLAALAFKLCGAGYPAEEILESWKLILLNQFHDIIPGSSIAQVYADSREQYEQVLAVGEYLASSATKALAEQIGGGVVVFNTLGYTRSDVARAPIQGTGGQIAVFDEEGRELPAQWTADGKYIFLAKDVPAKGWRAFKYAAANRECDFPAVDASGRVVETPALRVEFDGSYNIVSLIEKASGCELIAGGKAGNRLVAFEDLPFNHAAWDIKAYYREKFWYVDDVQSAEVVECGPVRSVLRVVRKFRKSTIRQDFIFYPAGTRVDVDYEVDWRDKEICLKCSYPVDVNAERATFDIQFGNIERVTHENSTWDFAQFEVCGHKWADLSDNGRGLSVLNDCKYGWTVKDGTILATLLRAPNGHHGEQDIELHRFTYALYPHAGSASQSDVVRQGYNLNVPLRTAVAEPGEGALPPSYSLVSADRDNIVIETVKKAEDSDALIVRAYECWNRKTEATLRFGGEVKRISECDLMEENDLPMESLAVTFKPFEIKTFKVVLA